MEEQRTDLHVQMNLVATQIVCGHFCKFRNGSTAAAVRDFEGLTR